MSTKGQHYNVRRNTDNALRYIQWHTGKYHVAPSMAKIGAGIGVHKSWAHRLVRRLIASGRLNQVTLKRGRNQP